MLTLILNLHLKFSMNFIIFLKYIELIKYEVNNQLKKLQIQLIEK